MGSNSRQKKAGFNLFSMFKSRRARNSEDAGDNNTGSVRESWRSDEDKGSYVADPRINRKAREFMAKFHAIRFSESERDAVTLLNRDGKGCFKTS